MSENFKLKVNIGTAQIELEGEGTLVHKIFSELREHGLGNLSSNVLATNSKVPTKEAETESSQETTTSQDTQMYDTLQPENIILPDIKNVVIRIKPKTEADWLVVYALYVSKYGTETFTANDLRQMYNTTNRFNESRRKNFSTNLRKCVSNNFFNCINDDYYSLTDPGKNKACTILNIA